MTLLNLLLVPVYWLAKIRGVLGLGYLQLYLKVQCQTRNWNKINVLVSKANLSELRMILKQMGAEIATSAYIDTHLLIHNAPNGYRNFVIASGCHVGKDCLIDLADRIVLEENVTLGLRVTILTHFDAGNSYARHLYAPSTQPVLIRQGAYVGTGSTILPGITIGEGAIVAAGALVNRNVPAYTIVGGVPAKVIREIRPEQR